MSEHNEICKHGAALLEAELRKPRHDQITVCAIHSTPDAPGRIVIGIPAPEDAPGGFEVVTPGWGVTDWRAVPYEHLFTLLKNATGRMPILSRS